MFDSDHFVINAAHGLIKKGDKYLVTLRDAGKNFMPNLWDIPGGTVEFGEHPVDALIREIDEETKIKVVVRNLIFIYDFVSGEKRHQFQMVYTCDFVSGEVTLNSREHQEYRWVILEEMKNLSKIAFLEELVKYLQK